MALKDELVYPKEQTLGVITAVLALMVWVVLIIPALFYGLFILLFYLFAQSALISWIRGNGVLVSAQQMPDLRAQYDACCARLGIDESDKPEAYLLQGGGALNAFAARFLGRHYVVLLSDVVDAMAGHPDGVAFYIGHELGHVRMRHFTGRLLRWPVLWLPLIGAAYSRAREYTCDRHGRACSSSPDNAARALVVLAAGQQRWRGVDLPAFAAQAILSRGFWMSYHELTGGYPWLTKRVARVLEPDAQMPRRHAFAWFLACFVPYAGRLGGAGGLLVVFFMIGILAAIALPAYQDYTVRAKLTGAYLASQPAREAIAAHFEKEQQPPETLAETGAQTSLPDGVELSVDAETMVLTVETPRGQLLFTPQVEGGKVTGWQCSTGVGVRNAQAPAQCRDEGALPELKLPR